MTRRQLRALADATADALMRNWWAIIPGAPEAYRPVPDTDHVLPATIGGWTITNACPRHEHARHHWTLTGDPRADREGFWAALAYVVGGLPYYSIVVNVHGDLTNWTVHVVVGDTGRGSVRMDVGCAPTCRHEAAT